MSMRKKNSISKMGRPCFSVSFLEGGKMNQSDVEIKTRILVQAQNDAVIVERLKRRINFS